MIRESTWVWSYFLLFDGLDGFPDTFHAPEVANRWLSWYLRHAEAWASAQVYIKAFLPSEWRSLLEDDYPEVIAPFQTAELRWTPERRRPCCDAASTWALREAPAV